MTSLAKKNSQQSQQRDKFVEAARALGCDDSEEAFNKKLKAVASAPPPKDAPKKKVKKPAK